MEDATPQTAELVTAGGAHIPDLLKQIEVELSAAAAGYGPPLADFCGQTITAGGKRLRPLLLLLCAGPPSDQAQRQALIRGGAAVELIHSATLVHDDVLDLAPLRRGRPTVFAEGGRGIAIATGDLLFARAFILLASNGDERSVQALSAACSALVRGELLQRADAWDAQITEQRYLQRCELKTARLFEAACEIGTAVGAGELDLAPFGRQIGVAFQLLDDVLDISGPAERTGKARGTDLLDGTVTLPLIIGRQLDPTIAAVELRSLDSPESALQLCDAIAASGALDQARSLALGIVDAAKDGLPFELDSERRAALELVANSVVARYS